VRACVYALTSSLASFESAFCCAILPYSARARDK